jgi:hypothetical protein
MSPDRFRRVPVGEVEIFPLAEVPNAGSQGDDQESPACCEEPEAVAVWRGADDILVKHRGDCDDTCGQRRQVLSRSLR